MKAIDLESRAELDALVKELCHGEEFKQISLTRAGAPKAVIISDVEYRAMKRLEESMLDKIDLEESEEILKDPQWIDWDQYQKQSKS